MINNYFLERYLSDLLLVSSTPDQYCPNGLQIEGANNITRIILGVSLTDALIDQAIACDAQAIIVHHGIFWNKDSYLIKHSKKNRIAKLITHNINLFAYHIPLDNHPTLGNNAQLANKLNITITGNTGPSGLIWHGTLNTPMTVTDFTNHVALILDNNRTLAFTHDNNKIINQIAWCTGGGNGFFNEDLLLPLDVDAYLTGEPGEPAMGIACESKIAYIAAGHYATERYGVMALAAHLSSNLNIDAKYIELFNPV